MTASAELVEYLARRLVEHADQVHVDEVEEDGTLVIRLRVASEDLGRVIGAIHEVLAANARVLNDPAPVVQVLALGESSVSIAVKPWVRVIDCVAAQGEINRAVLDAMQRAGVSSAYPRRDVRIVS